jgi:serine/threonine-protein kinase
MSQTEWRFGDRYEVLEGIGSGATGTVWRARDLRTGADSAVKSLRPELLRDVAAVGRLYAVLATIGAVAHPNILAADEVMARDGQLALISRLVHGDSLLSLLTRNGPMPPAVAAQFVAQLCDALAAAHSVGVSHGDVKPANVLVEPVADGFPHVLLSDFGVACVASDVVTPHPEYLAPELAPVDPPTPAGDVYATGIVLYEVLSGWPPFTGPDPAAIAESHRSAQPSSIPGLPNPLWLPIAACLDKNPQQRPTAADLAALLRDVGPLSDQVPLRVSVPDAPTRVFQVPPAMLDTELVDRALASATLMLPAGAIVESGGRAALPPAPAAALAGAGAAPGANPASRSGGRKRGRRSYKTELVIASIIVVLCVVVAAIVNNSGGRVAPGGPAKIVAAPAPTATTAAASSTPSPSPSPSASASPTPSASAGPTVSASPTAAATTQGPVTISWQCANGFSNQAQIRKTSCIGIGSDHQLYARGSFTAQSGDRINDIKVSLIDANGGTVLNATSSGCAGSPCSLVTGPFDPPPGSYFVTAGVDDSAHNENSPTITFP